MKTDKRGFTKAEVILLLAALLAFAAVFVIVYNKTQLSADCVAINAMNATLKSASKKSKPESVEDVRAILSKAGYNASDLETLKTGTYYVWDSSANKILLMDDNGFVLFPNAYKTTARYERLSDCYYLCTHKS